MPALSPQQARVVSLLSEGLTAKGIARHLGISPRTVEMYLGDARKKLNAVNSTHLVAIAARFPDASPEPLSSPSAAASQPPSAGASGSANFQAALIAALPQAEREADAFIAAGKGLASHRPQIVRQFANAIASTATRRKA